MITTNGARIWTPQGFKFADDLNIGDTVISFNPERGCCEYDEVKQVRTEYKQCMGYGLRGKSMDQLVTPDHPILLWNVKTKTLQRIPIEDRFMYSILLDKHRTVISSALFEPYLKMQDEGQLKLSARLAASVANHRYAPSPEVNIDMGGYEAQLWLDTFFHWNKMVPARNWMATVKLNNKSIRDTVFKVAPRAGVGIKSRLWRGKPVISMTENGYVSPVAKLSWYKAGIDGLMFNITTRNGSAVMLRSSGTFLIACDKENDESS